MRREETTGWTKLVAQGAMMVGLLLWQEYYFYHNRKAAAARLRPRRPLKLVIPDVRTTVIVDPIPPYIWLQ